MPDSLPSTDQIIAAGRKVRATIAAEQAAAGARRQAQDVAWLAAQQLQQPIRAYIPPPPASNPLRPRFASMGDAWNYDPSLEPRPDPAPLPEPVIVPPEPAEDTICREVQLEVVPADDAPQPGYELPPAALAPITPPFDLTMEGKVKKTGQPAVVWNVMPVGYWYTRPQFEQWMLAQFPATGKNKRRWVLDEMEARGFVELHEQFRSRTCALERWRKIKEVNNPKKT